MKKLFTLCVSLLLLGTAALAQTVDETFQFVDAEGNEVTDGTVITVTEMNEEGQMVVPLYVKNVSGEKAAVSMYETIDQMPGGVWQTCAFGNCMQLSETGYSPKNVVDADYNASIQTEWKPEAGQYATWEAKLQIHVFNIVTQTKFGVTTETVGKEIIGYGPTVTVRFEYAESNTQQVWWGYVGADDECNGVGVNKTETYDCAAFYPGSNEVVVGKTIRAVRFMLLSANVKDVKVWIAEKKPTNISTGTVQLVDVKAPKTGINEVELPSPYTVTSKGVYVGYTFTVTKLQNSEDSYPVAITGSDMQNALILRTSVSVTTWSDLNGQGFGRLYLQLLLEGEFPYANAATISSTDIGEYVAAPGGTAKAWLPITNMGTTPLRSFDYTISSNGEAGPEQHVDVSPAMGYGSSQVVTIEVNGDNTPGQQVKTITITKANGVANEYGAKTAQYTMTTVSKIVPRGIAVEEFTGTQCGWCPRGMAGMDKLRQRYGNAFVGAAVHGYANGTSDDAMYLTAWNSKYAKIFSGSAPSCQLNRAYGEIDPYYGTGYDICIDFENELSIPPTVGIELTGEWNADSTKVTAIATLEAVADGQKCTIEYALIADSLTGTTAAWNQANYYASYQASGDPDLDQFCQGGKYGKSTIKGWAFNDAVIATCYVSGKNKTTAPGELTMGEKVTNSYTLTMPTNAALKKAITKERVAVVCLVIAEDGTVANAAKYYMPGYDNTNAIGGVTTVRLAAPVRYSLDGRQLQHATKGLNIVRQADGTVRKVVLK